MEIQELQKRDNLSEKAYIAIKEMILSGKLKQGEAISINSMTEILGISRTPITNACQKLEFEKFLTIVPKQGVIVNSITIDDARELYELRAAIESYSAKRAFDNIKQSDIEILKKSLEIQKKYVESGNVYEFMKEDTNFHKFLLSKYNNTQFFSVINTLYDRSFMASLKSGEKSKRLYNNLKEHENIIEALEKKNKHAFVEAIEINILNGFINLTGNYQFK
ncbi:GntR family transcriptional regulator [Clostridium sp.]|uniref:GntR family transcriptional regulator n=1 Tax=Clostridium sp. TaxID=1506 RepID=UPI00258522A2|nr:GntR family transcriptional regulator [Clostridium sp.]MDF2505284.1 transcriptional regulator, GntR family with sensor domain containing protein [Clostridium sp.]